MLCCAVLCTVVIVWKHCADEYAYRPLQTGDSRRVKEWAGITGTIRTDMEGQVAGLRTQFRDEMEKNTDALLATLQTRIGEQLKSLREELISHPRFLTPLRETPGKSPFRGRRMTQKQMSTRPSNNDEE